MKKIKKVSKNHRCIIKEVIKVLYWVLDGTNIGPYCPASHSHPRRQQKPPARGQTIKKKHLFDDFYCFYKKKKGKHKNQKSH